MAEYLTIMDYKTAEENDIDRKTLYQRFYEYGWSRERAITEPKANRRLYKTWKPVLEITKVKKSTFYNRVISLGMTPFEACVTPVQETKGRAVGIGNPILTEHDIAIAEKNGIRRGTVNQRVYAYKWDVKRAITEPIHSKFRKKERQA